MVDTGVDTTVATGDMVDTTAARGRLMLRLLLLLSPRLMLRPTVDTMVDTLVDTTAATGDTVDTTAARGRLMLRPAVDMVDTMVDTGATVDTVDTTAARGR